MNVFEDLIVELKAENLLEETVMDADERIQRDNSYQDDVDQGHDDHHFADDIEVGGSEVSASAESDKDKVHEGYGPDRFAESGHSTKEDSDVKADFDGGEVSESAYHNDSADDSGFSIQNEFLSDKKGVGSALPSTEPPIKVRNGKEFYQKRAVNEVSSLQMVEHVLTGVEREFMKTVPRVFDDLNAKKALHTLLQIAGDVNSEGHAAAEFTLMQETEAWCMALAERDKNIPVSSMRQFCEKSQPALSSQALLALARFYRNLLYSESVRAKFDFVITRLFSRPAAGEKRVCIFGQDDMFRHIQTLYKEWSSIPLYTADDDESNVLLTALSFEDLAAEAENASTFDDLIDTDFFGRLSLFKESISELFFAPSVTVAAIDCNIRIGNAYVELIRGEREKMNEESLRSKYGTLHDQTISDAAARTFELVELLRGEKDTEETMEQPEVREKVPVVEKKRMAPPAEVAPKPEKSPSRFFGNLKQNARAMNKWLLAGCLLLILGSIVLYVWSSFFIDETGSSGMAKVAEADANGLQEYIWSARISGETYYGVLQPAWDGLTKDKKLEFLQKVYQVARAKGCTQVNLIGKDGKMAAFASPTRLDIVTP